LMVCTSRAGNMNMILTWPVAFRGIPSTIPNPAKTARIEKALDYS
jgi:hypothetical protein